MAMHFGKDPFAAVDVMKTVVRERELALSLREWNFRLAGHGFEIRETDAGAVVAHLMGGSEICRLPDELAF